MVPAHHPLRRLGVTICATVVLALLALIATPAAQAAQPAEAPAAGSSLRGAADSIMDRDYMSFWKYKAKVLHPDPFNWETDGCSGPEKIKRVYANLFNKPCQQHDFGYRNYGLEPGGPQLSPDEDTRAWIDARFSDEMIRLCNKNFGAVWQTYNNILCKGEATHVYAAVRNSKKAKDSFYS